MVGTRKEYHFKSASNLCDIFVESYVPDKSVTLKGIVQIAHGMAEHFERYEQFAEYLNENGYVVFINDHLGHGKSVASDRELGYFGKKDGHLFIVEDMKKVTDIAKEEYPKLPVILFGHSMGSFLARLYCEKYGSDLQGAVFCGTAGANPATGLGLAVIKAITATKGDHFRSKMVNSMAFGSYNKKIKPHRTGFDWLTKDEKIVDDYISDPYCGFLFTTNGYRDLMTLLKTVNRPDWYTHVPLGLPMYIICGAEDPVGNYSKGVKEVHDGLIDSMHCDVSMKIYPGDRHEILNELDKEDVYKNTLSWMNSIIDV